MKGHVPHKVEKPWYRGSMQSDKTRDIYNILKKVNNVQCTLVEKSTVSSPRRSVLTPSTERVGIKCLYSRQIIKNFGLQGVSLLGPCCVCKIRNNRDDKRPTWEGWGTPQIIFYAVRTDIHNPVVRAKLQPELGEKMFNFSGKN